MSEHLELTDAQRAAAVDRIDENLAVLSGAGCGKTLVLGTRFSELLMRGDDGTDTAADAASAKAGLRSLVALTFTEKAALEMAQRVRSMLAKRARQADGPERDRLRGWLEELPEARISTIHSFCASLLRAHAIDAGVDPGFAVAGDELICETMARDAADAAVLTAVEAGQERVVALLAEARYDAVIEHVYRLLEMRTVCACEAYGDAEVTLARWQEHLAAEGERAWSALAADEAFTRGLDELAAVACGDPGDRLAGRRDETVAAARAMLGDPAQRTPEHFRLVTASVGNVGSAKAWGSKDTVMAVRGRIREIAGRIEPLAVYSASFGPADREAAEALATLTQLARDANERYAAAKRARGVLDFTDLLDHTHRLLRERPAVRRAAGEQIRQLLIDECQDTDAFQVSLLGMLAAPDEPDGRVPPGRLFVVGDAKQSIYRFRGAQVEVFEDLCDGLGSDAQETLNLSFRTHEAGVAFVNHLFARLMGEDYAPITAHRSERPPQPSVEILLAAGGDEAPLDTAVAASRAQAALTAQRIREMLDRRERIVWDAEAAAWRPARPGDIAILFARMTHSGQYERELQRRDVPYHVLAGTGFFQRQEVFDVLNALRAIDNPFDDVAFFGVLRSSLFGLDDNALMHVAETHQPPYLPALDAARLADALPADQLEALRTACGLLRGLHRRKDALGIDTLIERLLEATGLEATLLSQPQGRRMLGNVRLLIDRARVAIRQGVALADFITQMNEMVINESRYEQAAVTGEAEDVVRLLTVHKAKGLEFPVVFVPDLNAGRRGQTSTLLHRSDWGLTCKLQTAEGPEPSDPPLSWQTAWQREKQDAHREDLRRLYVAATRHKDHLVFVGADYRARDGAFKSSGSYLAQMDEVLGIAAAVESPAGMIPYGEGRFQAIVRSCQPGLSRRHSQDPSPGRKLLAAAGGGADLAERILRIAGSSPPPPLLGPLPASVGNVELAVTALSEFEHCPMLYRWRYELRVPQRQILPPAGESAGPPGEEPPGLDAAALGTLLHRCMELLDFRQPQRPEALVHQAAAEIGLEGAPDLRTIAAELGDMLGQFGRHELHAKLLAARQVSRELDFVLAAPPATLRGQIDLLYQDAAGAWHIVDYKSDRVEAGEVAEHARRYELQLLAYAAAAARQTGSAVADATLYFLRPAAAHTFPLTPAGLEAAAGRIARLGGELIAARRAGQFAGDRARRCSPCPYRALCDRL